MPRCACLVACLGLSLAPSALAQCTPEWLPVGQSLLSRPGPVAASTLWDPDGPGPLPRRLVLGGDFVIAGDPLAPAQSVASWDGSEWATYAKGPPHSVRTLLVMDGELLAAGVGQATPGTGTDVISRWSQPVGVWVNVGGLFSHFSESPSVEAMAQFQGSLLAAGHFTSADGTSANHIARWNGSAWQPLGTGLSGTFSYARALLEHNSELIVAGEFFSAGGVNSTNIARWDGTSWGALGTGLSGTTVRALATHKGELFAAGLLTAYKGIAKWDGTQWTSVGNGLGNPALAETVDTLVSDGSNLFAAGKFTVAGTTPVANIARWDGTNWNALAEGITLPNDPYALPGTRLFSFGGKVGVAGEFTRAGAANAFGVALWDGAAWSSVPGGCASGRVQALANYAGHTYAGGTFVRAGDAPAPYLARRAATGGDWEPATPSGTVTNGPIWALLPHAGTLVAGGDFTTIASVNANRVARWDGTNWTPLGTGMASGVGLARVQALAIHANSLIAGGKFSAASGVSAVNVALWNGSTWSPLSSGVGGGLNDQVYSLASYKGLLFAGTNIVNGPLRVYNGSNWTSVTTPISGSAFLYALAVYNNELIVAGSFTVTSPSFTQGILRFNGTTWATLGAEPNDGVVGTVRALSLWNDSLLVGGYFNSAGGLPASNLGIWNGTAWSTLGPASQPGAGGGVLAIRSPYGVPPIIAGTFASAGEADAPITAQFGCACPADCDDDSQLTIDDFICFQTLFAVGHPSSDCDANGNLNVNDFICFQTQYAVGC